MYIPKLVTSGWVLRVQNGSGQALGFQNWVNHKLNYFGFKLSIYEITPTLTQIEPTFGVESGPQGPNSGSIRFRLAFRSRNLSDFSTFKLSCPYSMNNDG